MNEFIRRLIWSRSSYSDTVGSYGYNLEGLLASYVLALPFFGYTFISTLIFSVLIETVYKFSKNKSIIK